MGEPRTGRSGAPIHSLLEGRAYMVAQGHGLFSPADHPIFMGQIEDAIYARGGRRVGQNLRFLCPFHGDTDPSCDLNLDNGKWLCRSQGCEKKDGRKGFVTHLAPALGVTLPEMKKPVTRTNYSKKWTRNQTLAIYKYTNADGEMLCEHWRVPDPENKMTWALPGAQKCSGLNGIQIPLYRLAYLVNAAEAETLFVTEGEKDAESLAAWGLLVTSKPAGAMQTWKATWLKLVARRNIIICADNDAPGEEDAIRSAQQLCGVGCRVKIVRFPELDKAGDVTDWIARGNTREDFMQRVREAEPFIPEPEPVQPMAEEIEPGVLIISADHAATVAEATEVLAAMDPPVFFQKDRLLVCLATDGTPKRHANRIPGAPEILIATAGHLKTYLARAVNLQKWTPQGRKPALPTPWIAEGILSNLEWPFWALDGLSTFPLMRRDGSLCETPGYDAQTMYWYAPQYEIELAIPETPDHEDIKVAVRKLFEPFQDFPFRDGVDFAIVLSAIFTLLCRHLLSGNVPMFCTSAPSVGSGKTLIVDLIGMLALGYVPHAMTLPEKRAEQSKQILSMLLSGDPICLYDNIESNVQSSELATVLTSNGYYQDRILGVSKMANVRIGTTFFATGNNLQFNRDMGRRTLIAHLNAKHERPEDREGPKAGKVWKHRDVLAWTRGSRPQLMSAALTIMRGFFQADMPSLPSGSPVMGSFEEWSHTIRAMVVWALGIGIEKPIDPCARKAVQGAKADAETEGLAILGSLWLNLFDPGVYITLAAAADKGHERAAMQGEGNRDIGQRFIEALKSLLSPRGTGLSAVAMGINMSKYESRVIVLESGRYSFEATRPAGEATAWALEKLPED